MTLFNNFSVKEGSTIHKIQNGCGSPDLIARLKTNVDAMYCIAKDFLDDNFVHRFQNDDCGFGARCAELYFAGTFIATCKFQLEKCPDEGPDFYAKNPGFWIEVTAVTDGKEDNPNHPNSDFSTSRMARKVYADKLILRLTNGFAEKSKKIDLYIRKGIVKPNQPVVIGISASMLMGRRDLFHDRYIRAVLPISDPYIRYNRKNDKSQFPCYSYQDYVLKKTTNGLKPIPTTSFFTDNHAHISAVIFSNTAVCDDIRREDWGNDFVTIHNSNARNPLPERFIPCGQVYHVSDKKDEFLVTRIS